jgi:hypothetical protein
MLAACERLHFSHDQGRAGMPFAALRRIRPDAGHTGLAARRAHQGGRAHPLAIIVN